ncbi:amidase family protein [Streptomyces sp. NPDC002671]
MDEIATENHPLVDRILNAGGTVHARTTAPEFSIATYTNTRLWGVTLNPWNTKFTPGGSSDGADAALAGTTLLACARSRRSRTEFRGDRMPTERRTRVSQLLAEAPREVVS